MMMSHDKERDIYETALKTKTCLLPGKYGFIYLNVNNELSQPALHPCQPFPVLLRYSRTHINLESIVTNVGDGI